MGHGVKIEDLIKEQLNGQKYIKMNPSGSIYFIPGCNPEYGTLCGTNMFAIGKGKKRYMIDACQSDQWEFLENVKAFMKDQNCYFEKIFISHSHFDHMDGAYNLVALM
jgi:glyoxylase-like metal-dependent hydrolase (beta-lactamase superfamily II)